MKKVYLKKILKKGFVVIPNEVSSESKCTASQIAMLLKSFSSMNFVLDEDGIKKISNLSITQLTKFYQDNYKLLLKYRGSHVRHTVFYRCFPNMENISDEEYYVRAILHYLTVEKDDPGFMNQDISDFERKVIHNPNKDVLSVITEENAMKILSEYVNSLFASKTAIDYQEQNFLKEYFNDYSNKVFINDIPFKENVATYVDLLLTGRRKKKIGDILNASHLEFIKTPTDLLRVYALLECDNANVTLKTKIKFISLDRKARRLFLSILNEFAKRYQLTIEDLARHEFLWKKAFEKLHVGEYKKTYPFIFKVACDFRNDNYRTYYSLLEKNKDNQQKLIELLSERPGEFARRLDFILRNPSFDAKYTLDAFSKISSSLSSTLLIQLWGFFKNRMLYPERVIKIKGAYGDFCVEEADTRLPLSDEIITTVLKMIEDSLKRIYSTYQRVEKVYLDESLKNYALPTNNRNGSAQNRTLTYGTRIKLNKENGDFLRFFTHFKNSEKERVDVDLSLELVDESFSKMYSVSWHNMGGGRKFDTYHSGDITSAPKGASEFIDFNYLKARKVARYALVTNSVYTGQDYCDIPECFSGVMFLEKKGKKGNIFNPEFVKYKFDLTQKGSSQNIAFAIDLETLELIWMDCSYISCNSSVADENRGLILALKDVLKEKMSLYDFFKLHETHVSFVDSKEKAEIIISDTNDASIKPFDIDIISSQWL